MKLRLHNCPRCKGDMVMPKVRMKGPPISWEFPSCLQCGYEDYRDEESKVNLAKIPEKYRIQLVQ